MTKRYWQGWRKTFKKLVNHTSVPPWAQRLRWWYKSRNVSGTFIWNTISGANICVTLINVWYQAILISSVARATNINQEIATVHGICTTISVHSIVKSCLAPLNNPYNTGKFNRLGFSQKRWTIISIHVSCNWRVVNPLGTGKVTHILDEGIFFRNGISVIAQNVFSFGIE